MKQNGSNAASYVKPPIESTLSSDEIKFYTSIIHGNSNIGSNDTALDLSPSPIVVVVGAGLAGLGAARELKKQGVKVVLLEKADRIGGRCFTVSCPTFAEGVWGEAGGGMRFPSSHEIVNQYLKLFNLEKIPFANMKDKNGLLFFDGVKILIQTELNDSRSLVSRVICAWEETIGRIQDEVRAGSISWEGIITKYSDTSLLDFLQESGWSEELIKGFGKFGVGFGAYEAIFDLCIVEVLRMFITEDDDFSSQVNYQIKGGVEKLVEAFLMDGQWPVAPDIKCGCSVRSLKKRLTDDGHNLLDIEYFSDASGTVETIACNFCVMTAPLPNVGRMKFDPPLSHRLQKAIHNTHYVRSSKVLIQTKSPFWLNHGVDGMLISDTLLQNTYFLPPFSKSEKGLIVASYVWENQAEKLFRLSNDEKVKVASQELTKVFSEMETEFDQGYAIEWENAFSIFRPGQMKEHFDTLRSEDVVHSNICFAGEHCSVEHGFIEGALESGLRAATNILIKLGHGEGLKQPLLECLVEKNLPRGKENSVAATRTSGSNALPPKDFGATVHLQRLDHYTLIVEDAETCANFHINALGFEFVRTLHLNTGTVGPNDVDMLNYVLRPPHNPEIVLVITQGLTERTVFRKYMKMYGPGIHHIAFRVNDVDEAFQYVQEMGVKTTLGHVSTDPLSGLKQFFIDPSHAGITLELVEVPPQAAKDSNGKDYLASNNMTQLANSIMERHFEEDIYELADTLASRMAHEMKEEKDDIGESHCTHEAAAKDKYKGLCEYLKDVSVGHIKSINFQVGRPVKCATFLTELFNFQIVHSREVPEDQVGLRLYDSLDTKILSFRKAESPDDDRKCAVSFAVPRGDLQGLQDLEPPKRCKLDIESTGCLSCHMPSEYVSYNVNLLGEAPPAEGQGFDAPSRLIQTERRNTDGAVLEALSLFLNGSTKFANRPAYFSLDHTSKDPIKSFTFDQLHRDASTVAGILASKINHKSTSRTQRVVVATSVETTYEGYVMLLACLKNAYCYVNVCDIVSSPDFQSALLSLKPSILVTDALTHGRFQVISEMAKDLKIPVLSMDAGPVGLDHIFPLDTTTTGGRCLSPPQEDCPNYTPVTFPLDNEGAIFFTTGSTGKPKMASNSFRAILLSTQRVQKFLQYTKDSINWTPTGYEDSGAYNLSYVPSLLAGAAVVSTALAGYSEKQAFWLLTTASGRAFLPKITSVILLPPILQCLLGLLADERNHVDDDDDDDMQRFLFSPRLLVCYGTMFTSALRDQVTSILGHHTKMYSAYGSTEMNLVGLQDMIKMDGFQLHDGVEVRIDDDLEEERADGVAASSVTTKKKTSTMGKLKIRSDTMMDGYVPDIQQQNKKGLHLDSDGWYDTGDLAYITPDKGNLVLVGRTRCTININGDERHPANVVEAWTSILTDASEIHVIRDPEDIVTGESPVVFCRNGSNCRRNHNNDTQSLLLDLAVKAEAAISQVDFEKQNNDAWLLNSTSTVCFLVDDDFPRIGVRNKPNILKVEKWYKEVLKPTLMGKEGANNLAGRTYVKLGSWDCQKDGFDILDWIQSEGERPFTVHITSRTRTT